MKDYRKMNGRYAVHTILLAGIGYDIKVNDIEMTLHLYSDSACYEYNNISYHGYMCYRIGSKGKECAIYYNYYWDSEAEQLEYTAVIVNNDGVQIGKVD